MSRNHLRTVVVIPCGHKPHSLFTRAGAFFTRERADFVIGSIAVAGLLWVFYEISVGVMFFISGAL